MARFYKITLEIIDQDQEGGLGSRLDRASITGKAHPSEEDTYREFINYNEKIYNFMRGYFETPPKGMVN